MKHETKHRIYYDIRALFRITDFFLSESFPRYCEFRKKGKEGNRDNNVNTLVDLILKRRFYFRYLLSTSIDSLFMNNNNFSC